MAESRHRILIVDDESDMLELLQILLENVFDVEVACGGRAAIDEALATEYDAIVLDLMMPGIDGASVIEELRERSCTTPIVLVSALAEVERRARELGVFGGERKPVDLERLQSLIRDAIASSGESSGSSGGQGGTDHGALDDSPTSAMPPTHWISWRKNQSRSASGCFPRNCCTSTSRVRASGSGSAGGPRN